MLMVDFYQNETLKLTHVCKYLHAWPAASASHPLDKHPDVSILQHSFLSFFLPMILPDGAVFPGRILKSGPWHRKTLCGSPEPNVGDPLPQAGF